MSTLLEAALAYAARGWHVFPITPGQKKPATADGFKSATTNEAWIRHWWQENEDYNIGVAVGKSGLAVIDCDEWEGIEQWEELSRDNPTPETLTVRTPRGGLHYYFLGGEGMSPTQHKLGSRLDTRTGGSYVLVPPSLVAGRSYSVERDLPLAKLPVWIVDRVASLKKTVARDQASAASEDLPVNIARAVKYLHDLAPVRQGQAADSITLATACIMRDLGLSEPQALTTMLEHYDCRPQDDRYQPFLIRKIENAYKYAQNAPGVDAIISPPSTTFAAAADAIIAAGPRPRQSKFHPMSEVEMDALGPPTWLIPGLLPDGENAVLYGASRSFKSFVSLDLAISIAANVPTFAGVPTRHGLVFYVAMEGGASLKTVRRKAWRYAHGIDSVPNFYVMAGPNMNDLAGIQEFLEQIRGTAADRPIVMVVLDTGARVMAGADDNSAKDAGQFVEFCDHLREELSTSVLTVMHSGLEHGRIRGSTAFFAGFDTVLGLVRDGNRFASKLTVEKHKDSEERAQPFLLEFIKVGGSLVPQEIDHKRFVDLTQGDNPVSELSISRLLRNRMIGVRDIPSINTHALVSLLIPHHEGVDPDETLRQQAATIMVLNKRSRTDLAAYCERGPDGPLWRALPEVA